MMNYLEEIIFAVPESIFRTEILSSLSPLTSKIVDVLTNSTNECLIGRLAEILAYVYAKTETKAGIKRELEVGLQHLKAVFFYSFIF